MSLTHDTPLKSMLRIEDPIFVTTQIIFLIIYINIFENLNFRKKLKGFEMHGNTIYKISLAIC